MTKEDIIRMARESGYKDLPTVRLAYQGFEIQHFTNLVIAAERHRVLSDERAALAQPEQESVAWADMDVRGEDKGLSWTPGHFHKTPLYTAPPQRTWVGLTDEEILADGVLGYHFGGNGGAGPVSATGKAIVEVVSAMLKERNT